MGSRQGRYFITPFTGDKTKHQKNLGGKKKSLSDLPNQCCHMTCYLKPITRAPASSNPKDVYHNLPELSVLYTVKEQLHRDLAFVKEDDPLTSGGYHLPPQLTSQKETIFQLPNRKQSLFFCIPLLTTTAFQKQFPTVPVLKGLTLGDSIILQSLHRHRIFS